METRECLQHLNLSKAQENVILNVVAAVLFFGNLEFHDDGVEEQQT